MRILCVLNELCLIYRMHKLQKISNYIIHIENNVNRYVFREHLTANGAVPADCEKMNRVQKIFKNFDDAIII